MSKAFAIAQLKEMIRSGGYAWPGAYPTFALMCDGGVLCYKCCKDNFREIVNSTNARDVRSGWCCEGVDVNYEDDDMFCDHCNEHIESAYGSSDEDED